MPEHCTIHDIPTPALLIVEERVRLNCRRMQDRAAELHVHLRPHLKTAKSVDVAQIATAGGADSITVSTVAEVEYFARAGFSSIVYAVGIVAQKIKQLSEIHRSYACEIILISDSLYSLREVENAARVASSIFPICIEIDCGGGRGGVPAGSEELIEIARFLATSSFLQLRGVLTHAGHSYAASNIEEIVRIAEEERCAAVSASERLRDAGFPTAVVSVGSTPTAVLAKSLDGVNEIRPGVYSLCDIDQVQLGSCRVKDIAASVLTTVIGHNPRSKRILVDAGGLALSKDQSAAQRDESVGFGIVCDAVSCNPISGMHVAEAHQEHGFIAYPFGEREALERFPVGAKLRILPNHACMTAAPYDRYHVVRENSAQVVATWPKMSGWSLDRATKRDIPS